MINGSVLVIQFEFTLLRRITFIVEVDQLYDFAKHEMFG